MKNFNSKEVEMKINKDLISVIIPVYNVAEYIDRCVNSLLAQTYDNIEIILINDGSKDNSGEVCHRLANLYVDKIKVVDQENKGVSAARNAGLDIATGEYIMFVDADDWVSENYVEKLYAAITENDADLAACGFIEWYGENKQIKHIRPNAGIYCKRDFYEITRLNQVPLWATIYKKIITQQNKIKFDTLLRRMEDGCFVADYSSYCEKFVVIPDHLYYYYQREGSAINQYHQSTLLGVERSAYIIEILEKSYRRSVVGMEICEQQFAKKWVHFIPRTAVGVTNKKNTLNNKEKRAFLRDSIRVSKIKNRLGSLDVSKCTLFDKALVKWTKRERVVFLLMYGRCFNALKRIKHVFKG